MNASINLTNLKPNSNIVILTGAGISKESGLDTFRDSGGVWKKYNVEDVATYDGFVRNPTLVHDFYNYQRQELHSKQVKANNAHIAIAKLQDQWLGSCFLITQNIDDLHEKGGSKQVLHMHGKLKSVSCLSCFKTMFWDNDCTINSRCPQCKNIGGLRPEIVWFGEEPYGLDKIVGELQKCNLYIAIGTSGDVQPAASFYQAIPSDCQSVEVNTEATRVTNNFTYFIKEKASISVPEIVELILDSCILHQS